MATKETRETSYVNLRNVPIALKRAIIAEAHETRTSVGEVASRRLCKKLGAKPLGSRRPATNPAPNDQLNVRLPVEAVTVLDSRAAAHGLTRSSMAVKLLAADYVLPHFPRRPGGRVKPRTRGQLA